MSLFLHSESLKVAIAKFNLYLFYFDLCWSSLLPKIFWLIDEYFISLFVLNWLQICRMIIVNLIILNNSIFSYLISLDLTIINDLIFLVYTLFTRLLLANILRLFIISINSLLKFLLYILLHLLCDFISLNLHFFIHFV